MLRRILAFVVFIALIGAVSFLVYFNVQETQFRLTPKHTFNMPLGVLMLGATIAGALVMFVLALMREGRHALREWRVHRELRAAERTAEYQTEARSLALSGDFRRARALLAKATLKRAPDVSDTVDYADTFLLEGDALRARRVLEDAQKDFGNEPLLLYALARACRACGDLPAAISTLERAVRVYPASLPILMLLRDLLFEAASWQRACEVQERIIALKPNDEGERNWLAGARFEAAKREPIESRGSALRGITIEHPDFIPAVLARARELEETGEHRRAVRLLEKCAKRRPRSALLDELERITPEDKQSKLAKLYAKLVADDPGNAKLRTRAARFLVAIGRHDEAEHLLGPMSANGTAASAHALRAAIHEARADRERAQNEYKQAFAAHEFPARVIACERCDAVAPDWQERCARCGAWGTLEAL
jgi:tetratricopeptide (TPR) repeat protein